MVILRAGLCPGLTVEMIQLLKANSIATPLLCTSSVNGSQTSPVTPSMGVPLIHRCSGSPASHGAELR
uniref:RAD51D N-terminal domain-containing protein n=1 Tax=Gopherus agassizii TaxID=38772 RepID=A0A452GR54_9SAUR